MSADCLQHIIITRFNCRFGNLPKHLTIKTPTSSQWLEDRYDLFERYCVPTLLAQSCERFTWFVYFDRDTPPAFLDRAALAMERRPNMQVRLCDAFTIEMLREDIRSAVPAGCDHLLTTRLDNDDGLHSRFVERLHENVQKGTREALNFPSGLVLGRNRLYRSIQHSNAFISVSEPYDSKFLTVHCASHNEIRSRLPVRDLEGSDPAWLQVIHGGNVSNKLRGWRIPFDKGCDGFPPLELIKAEALRSQSTSQILLENLLVSTFWALRDFAALCYRRLRSL